jgi:hypothetical protein
MSEPGSVTSPVRTSGLRFPESWHNAGSAREECMSDTDKIRNILKSHIELMEKQKKGVVELLDELIDASAKLTVRTILARFDAEIILSQTELNKLKSK